MSVFSGLFYFLVLVGILIFIHEGGHFLVAKLFRVNVLVFSLGMGPRIFGFTRGGTDYRISAVPIGGYVRMAGEDPTAEEPDESAGSMMVLPAWKRFLIYVAGPAANLVFPLFLYFFLFVGQSTVPPAEIGAVIEGTPAHVAGLQTGDRIAAIDHRPVFSFNHMVEMIRDRAGQATLLSVERDGTSLEVSLVPEAREVPRYDLPMLRHLRAVRGQIGIMGIYPDTIVGVDSDSIAGRAGLTTFDRVDAVNDVTVSRMHDLHKALIAAAGTTVTLTVASLKSDLPETLFPSPQEMVDLPLSQQPNMFDPQTRTVRLTVPDALTDLEAVGIRHSLGYLVNVRADGPAHRAGMRSGDRLIAVNGQRHSPLDMMTQLLEVSADGTDTLTHHVEWERNGQSFNGDYKARYVSAGTRKDLGLEDDYIDPGFHLRPWSLQWTGSPPNPVPNPAPVVYALHNAVHHTLFWTRVILDVLGSLLQGHISPKSLSGPLGIGHAAAQVGQEGPGAFFGFMGFVSLNLGLLNLLLPIPVLDGGRLLIITTEVVTRRRLSRRTQERILLVGGVMILMLMVWAVIMDLTRLVVG